MSRQEAACRSVRVCAGVCVGRPEVHQSHAALYLRVGFIVKLLRSDPPPHQVIPDGVRQGEVIVPGCGDVPVLDQGEVQVAVEALLQLRHVLHLHDAPDADLLALLLVGDRCRHGWAGAAGPVLGPEVKLEG